MGGLSDVLTVITLKWSGKINRIFLWIIFADTEERIKDAKRKAYSRQSKISKIMPQKIGGKFQKKEVET